MQRPVYEDARNAAQAAVAAGAGQMQPHASSPFSHVPSADVPATPVRMVPPELSRAGAPTSPPPSDPPRPPMQGRATPERSKDDFVAAARRARRQVAGMPADLPPAAPAKTEPQLAVPAPTLSRRRPRNRPPRPRTPKVCRSSASSASRSWVAPSPARNHGCEPDDASEARRVVR